MEWLKVKGIVVNLTNVKHIEREGRFVVFHFSGDSNPLMVPFSHELEAQRWLESFFISTKTKQTSLDTTNWKIN